MAKNANNSNFFGLSAGQGATGASIQISLVRMLGEMHLVLTNQISLVRQLVKMQQMLIIQISLVCWYLATYSFLFKFFGYYVGNPATNASSSNFLF
jgi:hypothetical protein